MAAGILPKPGSRYLCKGACKHIDCAHIRADIARICRICGKPIGHSTRFYRDEAEGVEVGSLVHAVCLEEEVDREEKARADRAMAAVREVAERHKAE